ncbi:MAG: 5-carboxymethyl-2-hydroxymuconic-semialdehyde dehydrogenase, partial [Solirubrobacteraceae bacterium]|nr:5-carboxymethyl-2-hydroxymuconic-semialdehyde dehydrogenase [Solirubrobacteraceae bacterium]
MTHTQATAPRRAQLVEEIGLQRHYIDGEFRDAAEGGTFTTLDPATNEPITEAADGTAADVDAAVAAARRAFDEGPWPRMKTAERAKVLRRIATLIR